MPEVEADALAAAATAHGVDVEYRDWRGEPRTVPPATLRAVLAVLDGPRAGPPGDAALPTCVVIRRGATRSLPFEGVVHLEDGRQRDVGTELPADLPLGYHRLLMRDGTDRPLIVTPPRLPLPADLAERPAWGLAVQLYSVRSRASWGVGDLADLRRLGVRAAQDHGADFVLVNPVHAGEVVAPLNPSPYLPTSRRFANPIYLHLEDLPEYAALPPDERAHVDGLGARVRSAVGPSIDRDTCWAAKLEALAITLAHPLATERAAAFAAYRGTQGEALDRFATWCVLCEEHGNDWRTWPADLRDPASSAVDTFAERHRTRVGFFAAVQWLVDEQLTATQEALREAGMRVGVIHDVAVGVSPAGADAWANQRTMAGGMTAGAPPDAYSQLGQDWQQPPWRPDRLAEAGYEPIRDMVRSALSHSGGLRVDHIIGLFRLWWIPAGRPALEGTYVHYDHEALIGVLALEAERAGALIIGEDLGNVEPATRDYLAERGLLGTSILWFESDDDGRPLPADRWRTACLASVTTHDLPPTAGYLADEHIRVRADLGLLTRPVADEERDAAAARQAWRDELDREGVLDPADRAGRPDLVLALHRFLARTPSVLRCVALTDVVGERRTQNQPGTLDEYPNWRVPLGDADGRPVLLEDAFDQPGARELLRSLGGGR